MDGTFNNLDAPWGPTSFAPIAVSSRIDRGDTAANRCAEVARYALQLPRMCTNSKCAGVLKKILKLDHFLKYAQSQSRSDYYAVSPRRSY